MNYQKIIEELEALYRKRKVTREQQFDGVDPQYYEGMEAAYKEAIQIVRKHAEGHIETTLAYTVLDEEGNFIAAFKDIVQADNFVITEGNPISMCVEGQHQYAIQSINKPTQEG